MWILDPHLFLNYPLFPLLFIFLVEELDPIPTSFGFQLRTFMTPYMPIECIPYTDNYT